MEYWGYNDVASGTWVYYGSIIWTIALPILAFVLCFRYYRKAEDIDAEAAEKTCDDRLCHSYSRIHKYQHDCSND